MRNQRRYGVRMLRLTLSSTVKVRVSCAIEDRKIVTDLRGRSEAYREIGVDAVMVVDKVRRG